MRGKSSRSRTVRPSSLDSRVVAGSDAWQQAHADSGGPCPWWSGDASPKGVSGGSGPPARWSVGAAWAHGALRSADDRRGIGARPGGSASPRRAGRGAREAISLRFAAEFARRAASGTCPAAASFGERLLAREGRLLAREGRPGQPAGRLDHLAYGGTNLERLDPPDGRLGDVVGGWANPSGRKRTGRRRAIDGQRPQSTESGRGRRLGGRGRRKKVPMAPVRTWTAAGRTGSAAGRTGSAAERTRSAAERIRSAAGRTGSAAVRTGSAAVRTGSAARGFGRAAIGSGRAGRRLKPATVGLARTERCAVGAARGGCGPGVRGAPRARAPGRGSASLGTAAAIDGQRPIDRTSADSGRNPRTARPRISRTAAVPPRTAMQSADSGRPRTAAVIREQRPQSAVREQRPRTADEIGDSGRNPLSVSERPRTADEIGGQRPPSADSGRDLRTAPEHPPTAPARPQTADFIRGQRPPSAAAAAVRGQR